MAADPPPPSEPSPLLRSAMVYLVGAGPGDPGLLTLRGQQVLSTCDAVVYDYLADEALLDFAPPHAERVYVGKTGAHRGAINRQQRIHDILIHRAQQGQRVVRLKGGDPFVFGRGGEEAQVLREAGIRFEVVPGVSSAIAAPAYAGIPLTHRAINTSVAFITGHEDPNRGPGRTDWEALAHVAARGGTLVILMGVKRLERNMRFLLDHGVPPEMPVAVVRWGTKPSQRTVVGQVSTIAAQAAQLGLRPPAVVVVGSVVDLREQIQWFEQRPLLGKRVLITRASDKARALGRELRAQGAIPIELPAIAIEPMPDLTPLDEALTHLERTAWLLLTSANTVRVVMERLDALGLDARALAPVRLGCVGRATAQALRGHGLRADAMPTERHTSAALAQHLVTHHPMAGTRILLPQSALARGELEQVLTEAGAQVDAMSVYRTVVPRDTDPEMLEQVRSGLIDVATFASPSAVRNLA
ncbi:MAG: uroporphyrinogen-III C-methyltransferase, partial [Myxococcota bacterium]